MKPIPAIRIMVLLAALLALAATRAAPAAADAPPLLVLGDSLSAGVGASTPAQAYPARLAALLGRPVLTAGQSGRNLAGVSAQWAAYAGPTPAVLIVEIGVNDALNYRGAGMPLDAWWVRYTDLIASAHRRGVPLVVLVSPGPIAGVPDDITAVAAYADVTRILGQIAGVRVADTWPAMASCPRCFTVDGVHPTDMGHAAIARAIADAIAPTTYIPGVSRP